MFPWQHSTRPKIVACDNLSAVLCEKKVKGMSRNTNSENEI